MAVFHDLMQGSVVLPQLLSQQSLAVVHSAKSLTPELVAVFRVRPLKTYCSCKLVGTIDRQEFPSRSMFAKGADSVNEFCLSSRIGARGPSSAEEIGTRRMKGNSLVSFPSSSHSRSLVPSVFYWCVAIHGQTLDYNPWKNLVSGLPGPFRHIPALPLYCIPSRALRVLKSTHYGSIAGKKAGQDLLVTDSDKFSEKKSDFYGHRSETGLISALSSSERGSGDVKVKVTDEAVTVFLEDSDSESEDDEENMKKKHTQEKRLKGMQQEEEDSESESDHEDEQDKTKKCMLKGKVEVVGMSEDDSDSESDSDEEKKMKKKMKPDEKELKKQAKKEKREMKALEKMECEDSSSEGEDKKKQKIKVKKAKQEKKETEALEKMECEDSNSEDEGKKKKEKIKVKNVVPAVSKEEEFGLAAPDSSSCSEFEGEEDDVVVVLPDAVVEDEYEEEDHELVGEEDLGDEIESEIKDTFEEYEDEELDDEFWEDEEGEAMVGDGGDGGGVVLGDSQWEKKALELAEVVMKELGTDFTIYAFKASLDGLVRVRLDKLSDQYGSPTMTDLETFSRKYRAFLDSSELIPDNVAVEVSSPGAERMVNIPDELERFKQLPMYVQYFEDESGNVEKDGVLELDFLDSGAGLTVWKLADVKFNREQSGKGRPLNSKQRKWRSHVPLNLLKVVRLHLDV